MKDARAVCLAMLLAGFATVPARAATAHDEAAYRAALAEIDALQKETLALADALGHGMTRADASRLAPHMQARLAWLRGLITSASIPDTKTLRPENDRTGAKSAPPYARCLVWRAGEMEDHVQDVATDLALAARGAEDFIPLDREEIAEEGLRPGCPR